MIGVASSFVRMVSAWSFPKKCAVVFCYKSRTDDFVRLARQLGGVPTDRGELMLEGLVALLESKEMESRAMTNHHKKEQSGTPRGVIASRPPVQIHVHEDKKTGRNTTTIPPRVRREVLARDQHRCQAPGCGMNGEVGPQWRFPKMSRLAFFPEPRIQCLEPHGIPAIFWCKAR